MDLKRAIGIGIGLFLAIIGFVNGGVVVAGEGTVVAINAGPHDAPGAGVPRRRSCSPAALVARRVRGRSLIGIGADDGVRDRPERVWGHGAIWAVGAGCRPVARRGRRHTGLRAWWATSTSACSPSLGLATAFVAIMSVMLSDFFDTMGTAVGLGDEAGLLDVRDDSPGSRASCWSTGSPQPPAAPSPRRRTRRSSRADRGSAKADGPGSRRSSSGSCSCCAMFFSPIAGVDPARGDGAAR